MNINIHVDARKQKGTIADIIEARYSVIINNEDKFNNIPRREEQRPYFTIQTQNGKIQTNFGPDFKGNSD